MPEITVLVDNNTIIDKYFYGEPAFALYLEIDEKKILFDTGYSDVLIKNAQIANIDLENLDFIVLSHGHDDHTGGLRYLPQKTNRTEIIACEGVFEQRYNLVDGDFGSILTEKEVSELFKINYQNEHYWLSENAVFLGRIPRFTDFEAKNPVGFLKKTNEPDFVEDDSSLVLKTEKGLVIITGCAHSGIVNVCEYAKKVCKTEKIRSIIGGLHLNKAEQQQIKKTVDYIKSLETESLHACHCTGFEAQFQLKDLLSETGSGLSLKL